MSKKLGSGTFMLVIFGIGLVMCLGIMELSGIFASDPSILGHWNHKYADASIIVDSIDGDEVILRIRVDGSDQIPMRAKRQHLEPVLKADYTKALEPDRRIR